MPRTREQDLKRKAELSLSIRDIGYIESVKDEYLIIKKYYEFDLKGFLIFFYPEKYYRPFSEDQEKFIKDTEAKILKGGDEAVGMPRGEGKTTTIIGASSWALAYGHRRYPTVIGANKPLASNIMSGIKNFFDANPRMALIFPEMCAPCVALEGLSQRAKGQISNGETTDISWKGDKVVFAQMYRKDPEKYMERGMGAVVESRGMTSGVRGMQTTLRDGTVIRPDFVFLDDPQTRESARSPTQCDERESLINSDIAGLSGIGKKLSMIMAVTVICQDDLADRCLEKWQSVRAKALYDFPDAHKTLWAEYIELYREWKKKGIEQEESNKFYLEHREELDKGARVGNEYRLNEGEISALQNIYNYIADYGEASFYSELQNEPRDNATQPYDISPQLILTKCNGHERTVIPDDCNYITCGIDINHYALNWGMLGVKYDMTSYIIDYGQYPKRKALWTPESKETAENAIYNGVVNLCRELVANNPALKIIVVDGNYATDTVYRVVNTLNQTVPNLKFVVGRGVSSERYSVPSNKSKLYQTGYECFLAKGDRGDHIVFNSHYWHKHLQTSFLLEVGSRSSISLYGQIGTDHRLIANHICADKLIEVDKKMTNKGEVEIYKWTKRPGEHNDLSDGLVMGLVGASVYGADVLNNKLVEQVRRKRKRKIGSLTI